MRHALGLVMALTPIVAGTVYMVRAEGWKVALGIWATVVGLVAYFTAALWLMG